MSEKMENGVNYRILLDGSNNEKIVHRNRLSEVRQANETEVNKDVPKYQAFHTRDQKELQGDNDEWLDMYSDSEGSAIDLDVENTEDEVADVERRYPERIRQQRAMPGTIPWNSIII